MDDKNSRYSFSSALTERGISLYLQRGFFDGKSDRFFRNFSICFPTVNCYPKSTTFFAAMSFVASTDFVYANPGQERPFFWIPPVDEKGFEVDKLFEEAAYQKTRDLRLYRAQELLDEAVRAELVEKAVYAASRARKSEAVRDAKSYLFATFARLVDERITKERGLDHRPSPELAEFEAASARSKATTSTDIEQSILRRQVLEAMSPEDRWIWERRLLGYEVQEIAAELNVSADCLSTRIRRGINEVAKTLRLGRARQ